MKDRILIIEDEIKTAQSLKKGLEEYNYQVDCALEGEEGVRLASSNLYNLIRSLQLVEGSGNSGSDIIVDCPWYY